MQITEDLQRSYRQQESELMDAAGAYVESYLKAMQRIEPNASVAQIREATKVAIEDSLNIFGTQAAELAQGFFDQIAKGEDLEVSSKTYDVIDPELMDKKLHYFAGKLVNGDHFGFRKSVTDLTRYYVKRTAFENVRRNCQDNEIRYARVPSGRETCAFCFMLSSRGFVYHSEKTARGQSTHGMHQHCDCIIVPGVEGVTKIEGYDPDLMYKRWKQCARAVGIEADLYSFKNRSKIIEEVKKRDWKWLYSDKRDYSSKVTYIKPEEQLTDNEKKGIACLSSNGFSVIVNREDPKALANIDLSINGEPWEMKNIGDGSHSLNDRMRDAAHKWRKMGLDERKMKIVITSEGRTKNIEETTEEIHRRLKLGQEALFIDQRGTIIRIQK